MTSLSLKSLKKGLGLKSTKSSDAKGLPCEVDGLALSSQPPAVSGRASDENAGSEVGKACSRTAILRSDN